MNLRSSWVPPWSFLGTVRTVTPAHGRFGEEVLVTRCMRLHWSDRALPIGMWCR